jgi:hypothetical protein
MAKISLIQTNFTAGELSPRMMGRVDIARYGNGAKTIENGLVMIHGGVIRTWGTRFVAPIKYADRATILIPYVFNRQQSYMLEVGDLYMRIYSRDGALLAEVASPYSSAMLDDLSYVQGADTMFLAHPSVPIYRLRRSTNTQWVLAAAPFVTEPFDEIGVKPAATLTLSSTAVGTGITATASAASFFAADVGREVWAGTGIAVITGYTSSTSVTVQIKGAFDQAAWASGAWTIKGSPQTTLTPSAKEYVGDTIDLTLTASGWRAGDVGKWVRINSGLVLITSLTSDLVAKGKIQVALSATVGSQAGAWSIESTVWTPVSGYPGAITLHEQRLVCAGSTEYPQTVWMSRTGEYLNFEIGTDDDDAMSFTVSSNQINPIVHMGQIQTLIALTYGGEFTLSGGTEKAITPTNIQVKNQSVYGCNGVRPLRIGNELYFMQRANRKLRAMAYKYETDAYGSPDLSVLSEHLTETGIIDMAYQQEPESILWLVRADGTMATVTVDRDQDVTGWGRQTTDGLYRAVASIPVDDGETVWVVVDRTVNGQAVRYLERFDDQAYTHASITGASGAGASTWGGLAHLEGKTVDVVADGVVMPQAVVAGGQITLDRTAKAVEIGLPFTTTIETLTPEISSQTGTAQGSNMRIAEVTLRFLNTIGCKINGKTVAFRRFAPAILDSPLTPFTGDHRMEQLGWALGEASITITQDQPLPFHLLSVIKGFQSS